MIIEVNKLTSKPLLLEEDVVLDAETYKCVTPLISIEKCHAKVKAASYEDFIEVSLEVSADVILQSCYSLKTFKSKVYGRDNLQFASSKEVYEEEDFILYKGNKIQLDEYVFELVYSLVPTSPKAPGESLPKGGKDYRVMSEDEYNNEKENSVDHRFDKLDELDFD